MITIGMLKEIGQLSYIEKVLIAEAAVRYVSSCVLFSLTEGEVKELIQNGFMVEDIQRTVDGVYLDTVQRVSWGDKK